METTHFLRLDGRTWQRILYNCPQQSFWSDDGTTFSKSFAGFVLMFFEKTTSLLNGSVSVAYPVHTVLLNFIHTYKWWPVQSGQTLVAFLTVECIAKQQGDYNELADKRVFLWILFVCSNWNARKDFCDTSYWWKRVEIESPAQNHVSISI